MKNNLLISHQMEPRQEQRNRIETEQSSQKKPEQNQQKPNGSNRKKNREQTKLEKKEMSDRPKMERTSRRSNARSSRSGSNKVRNLSNPLIKVSWTYLMKSSGATRGFNVECTVPRACHVLAVGSQVCNEEGVSRFPDI